MNTGKKLKEVYKQMPVRVGVFRIRNMVSNRQYIEGSVNLDKIWIWHRVELIAGTHRNVWLQREWDYFGEKNFEFEIISEINKREGEQVDYGKEARILATLYIEELRSSGENGYH